MSSPSISRKQARIAELQEELERLQASQEFEEINLEFQEPETDLEHLASTRLPVAGGRTPRPFLRELCQPRHPKGKVSITHLTNRRQTPNDRRLVTGVFKTAIEMPLRFTHRQQEPSH